MKTIPIKSFLQAYFKFIKKFLPEQKADIRLGLDLGTREYKLVEVRLEGKDVHLVNCIVRNYNETNFAATVQPALDQIQSSSRFFSTAINGKGTLVRFLDFPQMTAREFGQSFAIEEDKYFPFPADEIYTDFQILEENSKSKTMSVIIAAAKKEIVDKKLEMLKPLTKPVGFMALHSIALTHAVDALGLNQEMPAEGGVALLDIGQTVSTLIIFAEGVPRFTRDIYIGGQDMTRRVGNAMSLSVEEAENLKCHPGERLQEVSQAVEAVVQSLIQELRLSFEYFATEKRTEVVKLYLTGGAAAMAGMEDIFKKNLETPVERWNILSSKNLKYDKERFADIMPHEAKLGAAFGLALYQYGKH